VLILRRKWFPWNPAEWGKLGGAAGRLQKGAQSDPHEENPPELLKFCLLVG